MKREEVKKEIEATIEHYFSNEASAKRKPGVFGEIIGKLESTKEILETAFNRSLNIANDYLIDKGDDEKEELAEFIKDIVPREFNKWFRK